MKSSLPEVESFTLQPAGIDLSSPRTQLILGMVVAVLNCVLVDCTQLVNPSFLLHIVFAVLVGLIVFEITRLYGNRTGAMPAIWAAFLISCCHIQAIKLHGFGHYDLCGVFVLLAFFSYQRFRLLKEIPYLAATIIFFVLSVIFDGILAAVLPLMLLPYEFIFRSSPAFLYRLEPGEELNVISPASVSARLMLFGSVWLALSLVVQMSTSTLSRSAHFPSIALFMIIFCIFFPLLTLPISGARDQGQARWMSIVGMILITAAAWNLHF